MEKDITEDQNLSTDQLKRMIRRDVQLEVFAAVNQHEDYSQMSDAELEEEWERFKHGLQWRD
jgi:hypothetical protein